MIILDKGTKVTIINDKDNTTLEEYTYHKIVNAKSLAEKKFNGVCVHSEVMHMIYERYWIKIND